METAQNRSFLNGKSQSKMDDDWGYHHFRKPPYVHMEVSYYKGAPVIIQVKKGRFSIETTIIVTWGSPIQRTPHMCIGVFWSQSITRHAMWIHVNHTCKRRFCLFWVVNSSNWLVVSVKPHTNAHTCLGWYNVSSIEVDANRHPLKNASTHALRICQKRPGAQAWKNPGLMDPVKYVRD